MGGLTISVLRDGLSLLGINGGRGRAAPRRGAAAEGERGTRAP